MKIHNQIVLVFTLLLAFVLAGCGGGGSTVDSQTGGSADAIETVQELIPAIIPTPEAGF